MRGRVALIGAALACGIALVAPAGAQGDGREPQRRMLDAVNAVRAQHGLGALGGSGSLNRSASRYAHWMLRKNYFGHLGSIRASGRFSALGETLAWHPGRCACAAGTVRRWMKSAPHRFLILHPGFRWLGAGIARGGLAGRRVTAWVLHFGGPLKSTSAAAPSVPAPGAQPSEPSMPSAPPAISATTSAAGASRASAAP